MKYHFKTHKEKDGYWAECLELPGCITEGNTIQELNDNMQAALNLYIEEPFESNDISQLPDRSIKQNSNTVDVAVDPQIAFAFLVRYCRLQKHLTQSQAAKLLGFDNLYSYQRLESRKCNPSLKTLTKLIKVFPDFSMDLVLKTA